jgi:hypothetical protein
MQQRLDCKAMAKIVQAGPSAGYGAANADLPRQSVKGATNLPFIEPSTTARRKEVTAIPAREQLVPANCVIRENL